MTITLRSSLNRNLTADEADGNITDLNTRLTAATTAISPLSGAAAAIAGLQQTVSALQMAVSTLTGISAPGAPTNIVATPGNAQVSVAFTVPTSNGGAAITSYTATIGSHTNSGVSSPIIVTGLTNGTAVVATVHATNSAGNSVESTASNVVTPTTGAAPAPVNSALPTITGNAQVGQTLSGTNGTWTNTPTSFAYQWKRAGVDIAGATASSYAVASADIGSIITLGVTASNAGGTSLQALSAGTATVIAASSSVPVNTTAPAVSGTAQVGQTLSVTTGSWTNTPTSYAYQWARGGTTIAGATSNTYVPVTADVGYALGCRVIAVNSAGSSAVANSNSTANVIAAAVTAHRYYTFQVDAGNGDPAQADVAALTMRTADGVDRAANVVYGYYNSADYPTGNNLTNGHTNAANWYTGLFPGQAVFDLGAAYAIDHITVTPDSAVVTQSAKLPTSITLIAGDSPNPTTVIKTWAGIAPASWGTTNGSPITQTFSVA